MVIGKNDLTSYRNYYLRADISQVILVILLFQIPNLVFAYFDYLHYEPSQQFILLPLRALVLAASLFICWLLKRHSAVFSYERLVFTWALLVGAFIIFINSTRAPSDMMQTVDLAILLCYYLLLPNKFCLRLIPAVTFTLASVSLLFTRQLPNSPLDVVAIVSYYIVINTMFFLISNRMYRFRRRQYQAMVDQDDLTTKLNRLATTDELTGIYNRREIFNLGSRELERYRRYGRVFTVMMLDIDHFKKINDSYGHRIGDQVLVNITDYIKQSIRQEDLFGRFGGEEFVLILPETRIEGASNYINRLGIGHKPIKA